MKELTYEKAIKRLEEITKLLENSKESLETSVELFQEGIELSKYCETQLQEIEKKVASILVNDKLEPFDEEE